MRFDIYHHYDRPEPVRLLPPPPSGNVRFVDRDGREWVVNPNHIIEATVNKVLDGWYQLVVLRVGVMGEFAYNFNKQSEADGVLRALGR